MTSRRTPDVTTRALESTRSSPHSGGRIGRPTIGYLATEIERDWALLPWHGLLDAAHHHEMNVVNFIGKIVAWPHYFIEQANVIYDLIEAGHLSGLIIWTSGLLPRLSEEEREAFCSRAGIPVVTLEGPVKGVPCITYENYHGMQAAMEHLIEVHGYRRVGFVGYIEGHPGFQERYRAYRDTLEAHGLAVEPNLVKWFPDDAHRSLNTVEGIPVQQACAAPGCDAVASRANEK